MDALSTATVVNGLVLGWSVAWPPGPINAEMIRRALLPWGQGGGFWAAWQLGLGACTGDFLWALGVAAGARFCRAPDLAFGADLGRIRRLASPGLDFGDTFPDACPTAKRS